MKFLSKVLLPLFITTLGIQAIACDSLSKSLSTCSLTCVSSLRACLTACWIGCTRPCNRSAAIVPESASQAAAHAHRALAVFSYAAEESSESEVVDMVIPFSITLTPPGATAAIPLPTAPSSSASLPVHFSMVKAVNELNNQEIVLKYIKGKECIAFIRAEITPEKRGHIHKIDVDISYRGQGYFAKLLEMMCDSLVTEHCTIATLNPYPYEHDFFSSTFKEEQKKLIAMYEKHHFSVSSSAHGIVTMKRDLRAHPPAIPADKEMAAQEAAERKSEGKEEKQ